jgi:hypothetical protein
VIHSSFLIGFGNPPVYCLRLQNVRGKSQSTTLLVRDSKLSPWLIPNRSFGPFQTDPSDHSKPILRTIPNRSFGSGTVFRSDAAICCVPGKANHASSAAIPMCFLGASESNPVNRKWIEFWLDDSDYGTDSNFGKNSTLPCGIRRISKCPCCRSARFSPCAWVNFPLSKVYSTLTGPLPRI